jgi:hypothetical protein
MAGRYENPNSLPPLMIRYTTLLDEENIKYRPPAFKRTLRLSDVRQILLQSAIIHPEDVFADQNGYLIAKDAEKSLKLSDIMSPTVNECPWSGQIFSTVHVLKYTLCTSSEQSFLHV